MLPGDLLRHLLERRERSAPDRERGSTDPQKPDQWWALNGTQASDPQFTSKGSITMQYSSFLRRLDVIVHLTGAALG